MKKEQPDENPLLLGIVPLDYSRGVNKKLLRHEYIQAEYSRFMLAESQRNKMLSDLEFVGALQISDPDPRIILVAFYSQMGEIHRIVQEITEDEFANISIELHRKTQNRFEFEGTILKL